MENILLVRFRIKEQIPKSHSRNPIAVYFIAHSANANKRLLPRNSFAIAALFKLDGFLLLMVYGLKGSFVGMRLKVLII